jgi:integrase
MRLRGLIIVLWRAGLRISEALALAETDLDRRAWEQLDPWLELRRTLPVGALFCVCLADTLSRAAGAADTARA